MKNKWLQLLLVTMLLVSQLLIGPIGTVAAYASETDSTIVPDTELQENSQVGNEISEINKPTDENSPTVTDDNKPAADSSTIIDDNQSPEVGSPNDSADDATNVADNQAKKGFHLELTKATLGPNDEEFSEVNPLNPMNEFFVHYKCLFDDGHGYDAGDMVSIQLPKQLNILANADDFGTVFEKYHVAT